MMMEYRGTKLTPGRELTLNGFQILSGKSISFRHPSPGSRPSTSHGSNQTPSATWSGDGERREHTTPVNKNRFFFTKDAAAVLIRTPTDNIAIQPSRTSSLNSDATKRDCRRNSETFRYRLLRDDPSATSTCSQSRNVFRCGKRLPTTPRPTLSPPVDPPDSPGRRVAAALICTKSTLTNPCTRPILPSRRMSAHRPPSSSGKDEQEREQNLAEQPRSSPRKSSTSSLAVPPSVTCLYFGERGKPPPAELCSFSDPFAGASAAFHKRIAELTALVAQTVNWEKRKQSKTSKLQTKIG